MDAARESRRLEEEGRLSRLERREEEMARLREQNEVMRLRISEYKGFIDRSDRKEETWLAWLFPCAPAPVEKVEWGMDGRRVVHHHGL